MEIYYAILSSLVSVRISLQVFRAQWSPVTLVNQ